MINENQKKFVVTIFLLVAQNKYTIETVTFNILKYGKIYFSCSTKNKIFYMKPFKAKGNVTYIQNIIKQKN